MDRQVWQEVDEFLNGLVVGEDEQLLAARRASDAAGLPPIAVSAPHGKLLHILALSVGARRVLEIGTLGGYSTIWLARAVGEGGQVVTLEYSPKHAEVAAGNLKHAGLDDRVDIRVGAALDTLPSLAGGEAFDLVFVDADKENNAAYFSWALQLSRPGSLIYVDNVVRGGRITRPSDDPAIEGTRRLFEAVAAESGVTATVVQTVGDKGYDGFLLARVG
jgi:predicted O-methyltransferase YrrM